MGREAGSGVKLCERSVSQIQTVIDFIDRELPGVHAATPEGTFLAWLDCREAGIEGDVYRFFLEKARVALNDGKTFGAGG